FPVAAIATRDGVFVAVNRGFEGLTGWKAEDVIGKSFDELLGRLVVAHDRPLLERVSKRQDGAASAREGSLWCRALTAAGEERPLRVDWRRAENGRHVVAVLLDAHPEAFGQEVTAALARSSGALARCATETEVL